jgi:hypothetical protein
METYSRCYASATAYVRMTPAVQQLLRPIEEAPTLTQLIPYSVQW